MNRQQAAVLSSRPALCVSVVHVQQLHSKRLVLQPMLSSRHVSQPRKRGCSGVCLRSDLACFVQGMWELSINKQHQAEMELHHLQPVMRHLQHPNIEVSRMCAATVWGLAVNEQSRALLLQLNVVEVLLSVAHHSLTMQCIGDQDMPGDYVAGGKCSQTQRNQLQVTERSQTTGLHRPPAAMLSSPVSDTAQRCLHMSAMEGLAKLVLAAATCVLTAMLTQLADDLQAFNHC